MDMIQAREALRNFIKIDKPVFLRGKPGVGKSELANDVCTELFDGRLVEEPVNTLEPIDMRGAGFVDNGNVKWAKPDFIQKLEAFGGKPCALFFDEMNTGSVSMMASLMRVIQIRRAGPHPLPPNCYVFGAGNSQADRAAANRMPTALIRRVATILCETTIDSWVVWAEAHGISQVLIDFLKFRDKDGLLHKMPPSHSEEPFPNPGSWTDVDKVIRTVAASARQRHMACLVGEAAATECEGYIDACMTLPSIASIFADPAGAKVPEKPSGQYAVAAALSRRADASNFHAALAYCSRLPREFEIVCGLEATKRDEKLKETSAYVHWASRNADVTI